MQIELPSVENHDNVFCDCIPVSDRDAESVCYKLTNKLRNSSILKVFLQYIHIQINSLVEKNSGEIFTCFSERVFCIPFRCNQKRLPRWRLAAVHPAVLKRTSKFMFYDNRTRSKQDDAYENSHRFIQVRTGQVWDLNAGAACRRVHLATVLSRSPSGDPFEAKFVEITLQ